MNSELLRHFPAALFLSWLLLALPAFSADSLDLPELGSLEQEALDAQSEKTFRNAFLSSLYSNHGVIEDPLILLWLDRLGRSLTLHAPPQKNRIQFLPIKSDAINAFAGPGGIIGIHRGLILAAHSTDEVAAVLAHEIGHVTQHHLLRRFSRAGQNNLSAFATLLAALLIGQADPQAGMAAFYAGNALNLERQLKFSRHHETEADAVGIGLLAESGYDPKAMAQFFLTLQARSLSDPSQTPEVLRTHPVTPHRIAAAENRMQTLSNLEARPPHLPPLSAVQALLATDPAPDTCISRVIRGKAASPSCVEQLHNQARKDWIMLGTLLRWSETHDPKLNQTLLDEAGKHFPNNPALLLIAARIAFNHNQDQHALKLLERIQNSAPPALRSVAWHLQAQVLEHRGEHGASLLALAQAATARGEIRKAQHLLQQIEARRLTAKTRVQLEKLRNSLTGQKPDP